MKFVLCNTEELSILSIVNQSFQQIEQTFSFLPLTIYVTIEIDYDITHDLAYVQEPSLDDEYYGLCMPTSIPNGFGILINKKIIQSQNNTIIQETLIHELLHTIALHYSKKPHVIILKLLAIVMNIRYHYHIHA